MRRLKLASVVGVPWSLNAQEMTCDPDTIDCWPLVACIEETGEYFRGTSFGQNAGLLQATN